MYNHLAVDHFELQGCRLLAVQMLQETLKDLIAGPGTTARSRQDYEDSLAWINQRDGTGQRPLGVSFDLCMDALGKSSTAEVFRANAQQDPRAAYDALSSLASSIRNRGETDDGVPMQNRRGARVVQPELSTRTLIGAAGLWRELGAAAPTSMQQDVRP